MTGVDAFIGVGANLGDAQQSVRAAIDAIATLPSTQLVALSPLYLAPAWGGVAQPDFVNAVVHARTGLTARELLNALLRIELAAGRQRDATTQWGPRVLDLDILIFGSVSIDEPGLRVPHPHLHERAFVLVPLHDIAPDLQVPGRGSVAGMLGRVGTSGLRRLDAA